MLTSASCWRRWSWTVVARGRVPLVFTFTFLLYPPVAQCMFQSFLCQRLGLEENLLLADFQVSCETDEWQWLASKGSIGVLVYPLGIPASLFVIMFYYRKELRVEESRKRKEFDPIVGDYHLQAYWWEAFEMLRKVTLTG